MVQSTKDLRILLSKEYETQLQEIINILGSIETMLAHDPENIPLDLFLDWSTFVHKWYWMFTVNLKIDGYISYNKFKKLSKDLQLYYQDFKNILQEKQPNIIILLTTAVQKTSNLFTDITVGACKNGE